MGMIRPHVEEIIRHHSAERMRRQHSVEKIKKSPSKEKCSPPEPIITADDSDYNSEYSYDMETYDSDYSDSDEDDFYIDALHSDLEQAAGYLRGHFGEPDPKMALSGFKQCQEKL